MLKFLLTICLVITAITLPATYAESFDFDDTEVFFFSQKEVEVPIIMYHLITERSKLIGKYGVTPAEVEDDLVFLKQNGYTTVVMQDLINFVKHGEKLPQKAIMLTFDDGNASDFTYLLPLLRKHEMKAVLAIMGDVIDRDTKTVEENPKSKVPYLTWPQVRELHESGLCEIQSHGYNVHGKGGSSNRHGESADAYHKRLTADLTKLQDACKLHLNYTPNTFIYPLGAVGKNSRKIIEDMEMVGSLGCEEGINIVRPGDIDCLFEMHRFNRPSGKPVGGILERMEKMRRK